MPLRHKSLNELDIEIFTSEKNRVNSILIELTCFFILIDTQLYMTEINELNNLIDAREQSSSKKLKYIINTHYHSDHCYGNNTLRRNYTSIIAHKDFKRTITSEVNKFKNRSTSLKKNKIKVPDITFNNELIIESGKKIYLYSTPGHSSDSIVIYLPEDKIVITGDNTLNSDNLKYTLPYFFWGSLNEQINSLNFILNLYPEIIIPGHGELCGCNKIKQDIDYLEKLKKEYQTLKNLNKKNKISFNDFKQILAINKLKKDIIKEDIILPEIHDFNLENLFQDYEYYFNKKNMEEK